MGVPSYFYWLYRHFKEDILSTESPNKPTHHFYLDFNAGIHPAARAKPNNSIDNMYIDVLRYLEYLIDYVKPTELVYIAIDGVAPAGKMHQQRMRRFKSVKETREIDKLKQKYGEKIKKSKDFNMISPATEFMSGLSRKIINFIKNHKNGKYKHIKIIFSDSSVPGEGEHKILSHIRGCERNKNCVIYGLDSDLIFLALSTNRDNVNLIREDNFLQNNHLDLSVDKFPILNYFIIEELKRQILYIMNPYMSLSKLDGLMIFDSRSKNKNKFDKVSVAEDLKIDNHMKSIKFYQTKDEDERLIRDYIFISYLLGNDFLPSLESVKIRENGIEQSLRSYKTVIRRQHKYLVKANGSGINLDFLLDYLQVLAKNERNSLKYQKVGRDRRIKKYREQDPPKTYLEALDVREKINQNSDPINAFGEGWENRYYKYFFRIEKDHSMKSEIDHVCYQYFKTLIWNNCYYFKECPDWTWFYHYNATPLLRDLVRYVVEKGEDINQITFGQTGPTKPFYQLLTILPPQSAELLPKPFHYLMKDSKSPIIQFYPTDFETECYGKKYLWECHPKIPMIHASDLEPFAKHFEAQLSSDEKQRNQISEPSVFN